MTSSEVLKQSSHVLSNMIAESSQVLRQVEVLKYIWAYLKFSFTVAVQVNIPTVGLI